MMKKYMRFFKMAAAISAAVLPAVSAAAGPFCYEDEYIGLYSGAYEDLGRDTQSDRYDLYDSEGELCGSVIYASYDNYLTVPKNTIVVRSEDGKRSILNTGSSEIFFEFDKEKYYDFSSDLFCEYDKTSGSLKIYDLAGNLITETKVPEVPDLDVRKSGINISMYRPDGAVIVRLHYYNYEGGDASVNCIWRDGAWKMSTEPDFPETLKGEIGGTIGKYLLFQEGEEEEEEVKMYNVFTIDGLMIMKDVMADVSDVWGESLENKGADRVPTDRKRVYFVRLPEGDHFRVFDEELDEIALTDEDISELKTRRGYAVGIPADVLGERKCAGTLTCGEKTLLYALEGGTIYVEGEGSQIELSLFPNERPWEMNDMFIITHDEREKKHGDETIPYIVQRVWSRETGECVLDNSDPAALCEKLGMDPEKSDGEKTLFKLTGDGVMATTGDYYEARYRDRFYNAAILDNDLHVTFSSQSAKLEAARNCSYYYESGPYIGLVDKNGSWLIKLLPYAE